jgi:hypothetical protein
VGRAVASDINDRGVVAGHRWTIMSSGVERAMVTAWTKGGPLSPALEVGVAVRLNKKAWVLAYGYDENDARRPDGHASPVARGLPRHVGGTVRPSMTMGDYSSGARSPPGLLDHRSAPSPPTENVTAPRPRVPCFGR